MADLAAALAAAGTLPFGDRTVPRLGLGTMRMTGPHIFGPPADRDECIRVLRRAVDLGIRVLDTSWYYGPFVVDELIREALSPYPDDLLIVAKHGGARTADGGWRAALTDAELREGVEHDLRLLGLESLPATHLRWIPTPATRFEDALATMLDLQRAGKIQRLGLSTVNREQLDLAIAETPIVSVSNPYGVTQRDDDPMVDRCAELGIGYLPYFSLGASPVRDGAGVASDTNVAAVAARHGVSPTQVAIAWQLHRSPALLPIPGTSRVAHLEDNVAAAGLELTSEDLLDLEP